MQQLRSGRIQPAGQPDARTFSTARDVMHIYYSKSRGACKLAVSCPGKCAFLLLLKCSLSSYRTVLCRRRVGRLSASTLDTAPFDLDCAGGLDTALRDRCLQAAIDLQERGWTIVENVFSQ